ncbi:TetR/AcrR family transcriptional regulator [Frankia sp. R82]|uniref:TetR/AcrR family transcriptional regulator n=1 Tax=Frankia sp. R82 TaxID=2950553 RepID=UPI002043D632|nr:TetR/AcrR family transcriptional regulator [Frankia sp. R82]MCM3885143.1 TetR/AcrR family transcriptional regulator [Frankia sp. R82]
MAVVKGDGGAAQRTPGWWGSDSALLDDEEARRRLVNATMRCLVQRGNGRIRVEEVALEAGVSRSTVYRYFRGRDDLILAVLLGRIDRVMTTVLNTLPHPDDAQHSLCEIFLGAVARINSDTLNEAVFPEGGRVVAESLHPAGGPIVDAVARHLDTHLHRWQADGQLHADLDLRETVMWLITAGGLITRPPWSTWSPARQREFVVQHVVRALVIPR